jgi:hypothetical protein
MTDMPLKCDHGFARITNCPICLPDDKMTSLDRYEAKYWGPAGPNHTRAGNLHNGDTIIWKVTGERAKVHNAAWPNEDFAIIDLFITTPGAGPYWTFGIDPAELFELVECRDPDHNHARKRGNTDVPKKSDTLYRLRVSRPGIDIVVAAQDVGYAREHAAERLGIPEIRDSSKTVAFLLGTADGPPGKDPQIIAHNTPDTLAVPESPDYRDELRKVRADSAWLGGRLSKYAGWEKHPAADIFTRTMDVVETLAARLDNLNDRHRVMRSQRDIAVQTRDIALHSTERTKQQ